MANKFQLMIYRLSGRQSCWLSFQAADLLGRVREGMRWKG
jgi:hypothetical protein